MPEMEVYMPGFDKISEEGIADAAFFAGLLTPSARLGLTPLPVRVYGIATIAFCIRAEPVGRAGTVILHPVAIVPHHNMIIQDLRHGLSEPLDRAAVTPLDIRQAKLMRAALSDPETFFGIWTKEAEHA